MANLSMYQMTEEWQGVFEMLCDPEVPEDAVLDTIEMIEADMDLKADSYAKIMKTMDGDISIINAEIKRLQERKAALESRKNWLKSGLEHMMRATGRVKFKTALFSFNIQKNGGVCPVLFSEDEPVPAEWLKPGDPDTAKIRKHLEAGNTLPFAALGERGESLRIR